MKKIFMLLMLLPMIGFGAFTATGTGGAVTQIGATHAWYLANVNYDSSINPYAANKVYFDINYTKGDETSIQMTVAYCFTAAVPVAGTLSYFPEADSSGVITAMSRTMSATKRYTISVEVPDRARWVIITFTNTGGTPTGTVVIDGYMNRFN